MIGARASGEVFGADLLALLARSDGDEDTTEAEAAGCRKVVAMGGWWGLYRAWDEPEEGDHPVAVFAERPVALLAAAVWEAQARSPLVRLDPTGTPEGFLLWGAARTSGSNTEEPLGWLPNFDPQLGAALGLAAALVRDPEALATLLEAAGAEAVTQVDRILRRRAVGRPPRHPRAKPRVEPTARREWRPSRGPAGRPRNLQLRDRSPSAFPGAARPTNAPRAGSRPELARFGLPCVAPSALPAAWAMPL